VEEIYNTILDADPTDQTLLKRKIALSKAQGQTEKTVKLLMEYLNIFMADTEAWLELADIYIGLQLYDVPLHNMVI
jgi:Flp pilus assembly protein TadD